MKNTFKVEQITKLDFYLRLQVRRFNGVFSRNNLSRIKGAAYVINLDDQKSNGTYWVSLFNDKNTVAYLYFFGIEYISQELLNNIKDKYITHNIK